MLFSRIHGTVVRFDEGSVLVDVGGIGYDIILAPCISEPLRRQRPQTVTLEIHATLSIDGNSARANYFGFNNSIEREFFEALISVASIGPRTAARAFSKPMAEIARAIDAGEEKALTTLPGIGRQKAREIIAKLQGKVARFLLIPAQSDSGMMLPLAPDFVDEAMAVLLQLGYKDAEAAALIEQTREADSTIADVEALLGHIYRSGRVAA